MDSTMRSRTSRSPLPHGTTTRTAPKQTVTFIIRITFPFSVFPFVMFFCAYQPFAILLYGNRISHLCPLPRHTLNRLEMENSLLTPHSTVVVSELCQLFVAVPKAQALLIVFSRCLATTRARANKTKTHDTPAKWILIVRRKLAKSQASVLLSLRGWCLFEENTKIPFVSLRGSHSVDDPACAGVGSWLEPQLFHKTEWNKKKRWILREAFTRKQVFRVSALGICVSECLLLIYPRCLQASALQSFA